MNNNTTFNDNGEGAELVERRVEQIETPVSPPEKEEEEEEAEGPVLMSPPEVEDDSEDGTPDYTQEEAF